MFIQDVFQKVKDFFLSLASLSIFTRVLYFSLIAVFINLIAYRLIFHKVILVLSLFIVSEIIRVVISDYFIRKSFNLNYRRNFSNTIDSIAILILFSEIIFFSNLVPVIFWTKPINLNFRMFSDNYFKILFASFSKSIVSLFLIIFCLLTMKNRLISNIYLLKSLNAVLHINIGLLILGLIPLAPFDMGIALEHLATFKIRAFLSKLRYYSSIILFLFYYFGILSYILNYIYSKALVLLDLFNMLHI